VNCLPAKAAARWHRSRITHHASRITHHALQVTRHKSCRTSHAAQVKQQNKKNCAEHPLDLLHVVHKKFRIEFSAIKYFVFDTRLAPAALRLISN
jgi:hypothetical protein